MTEKPNSYGGHKKPIYRGEGPRKRGGWKVCRFKEGLVKKRGWCFWGGDNLMHTMSFKNLAVIGLQWVNKLHSRYFYWADNLQFFTYRSRAKPDFSQACSLYIMLLNHKNFCFTQIPNKTNNVIFLKNPKTLLLSRFWPFLVIFAQWGFFPKNLAVTRNYIWVPNTMLSFRKN